MVNNLQKTKSKKLALALQKNLKRRKIQAKKRKLIDIDKKNSKKPE